MVFVEVLVMLCGMFCDSIFGQLSDGILCDPVARIQCDGIDGKLCTL